MADNLSYTEQEQLLTDALKYKARHPTATFHYLESQFKINKDWINHRYHETHTS